MPSWSSWRSSSARRSMPSACPTPRRSRPRIRCSAARWCALAPGDPRHARPSTTCCSRSAAISSRCRCRPTSIRCRKGSRLIHLDIDPWEIGKNYPAEVAILGDPKATLPELTAAVRERMSSGARGARARAAAGRQPRHLARAREPGRQGARRMAAQTPIQPLALLRAVGDMLPNDAVVVEEALSSGARHAPAHPLATIRRASSACAAAASAGACRRRSASSSRCRTARWSR